jgi:hypothetical protein
VSERRLSQDRFGFVAYRSETSHDVKELLDQLKDSSHVRKDAVAVLSALDAFT